MTWPLRPFAELLRDVSAGSPRVQQSEYGLTGRYPVVDQGNEAVAGYIDDEGLLSRVALPTIIFGDHTRRFKYVDTPFAVGADGVKLLQPSSELDARYAYQFFRSIALPDAGYSRHFKFLREVKIPLPPLPEQRRIASILDEASELARKRRQQLRGTDSLLDATYSEMFGDLDANDRGWPMGVVHDLVSGFSSGKSIVGDDESGSSTFRVLKISAVTTGRFDPAESKPLPPDYTPPERHLVARGDLLISRANTSALVGATALVQDDVQGIALPDKIWRFEWAPGVGDPSVFVWQTFSRPEFRRRISEIATGTSGSMKNISQAAVLSLPMPVPPIERRQTFANEFSRLDRLRKLHLRDLAKLDELFASLQYRAFRGEL